MFKVSKERLALKAFRVIRATTVLRDSKVRLANKGLKASKVRKVIKVP